MVVEVGFWSLETPSWVGGREGITGLGLTANVVL